MSRVRIKIASINTWKGDGDYFQRMQVMHDQLKELKADIILCQECFATTDHKVDTLRFLADEFKMNHLFTSARLKMRLFDKACVESYSGLGILSRFPVVLLKEFSLPFIHEDGERKVQIATVELPLNQKVIIINLHLTHLKNAVEIRKLQIKSIAREIKPLENDAIKIIGGDFNAEIHSDELSLLRSILKAKDCYAAGHGKMPRNNNNTDDRNDFQVNAAIDHLFVLPDDKNNFPDIIDSEIVLNKPDRDSGQYASDHPAITTTLVLHD